MLQFAAFPNELKTPILSYIGVEESLKMLRVDKEFRSLFLSNGPFLGKFQLVDLRFSSECFHIRILHDGWLPIRVGPDSFEIDNQTLSFSPSLTRRSLWSLINKISFCRKILIIIYSTPEHQIRGLFERAKFLPKVRSVSIFSVHPRDLRDAKQVLDNLKPVVFDHCELSLFDDGEEAEAYFSQLLNASHYEKCQTFKLDRNFERRWEGLAKTNAEILQFHPYNGAIQYKSIIWQVLTHGIPSKKQAARVEFSVYDELKDLNQVFDGEELSFQERFAKIINWLKGNSVESIEDGSREAVAAENLAPKVPDEYRMPNLNRSVEAFQALLKKKSSDGRILIMKFVMTLEDGGTVKMLTLFKHFYSEAD